MRCMRHLKMKNLYYTTLILVLFVLSGMNTPVATSHTREYPTGLDILVYYDDLDQYSTDYAGLTSNYTAAGNTVTVVTQSNWSFDTNSSDAYDVIFLSDWGSGVFNGSTATVANNDAIKLWFDSGDKLLWVGSDSDFGGSWVANQTNPLLAAIGTELRFDAGAIADPESNDGSASYRVVGNETGVSSEYVDTLTAGFVEMVFHGPTSIIYTDDSDASYKDLRNATLTDVDVLINSSAFAEALDQDVSVGDDDYYAYLDVTLNGSYPMLVVDHNANGLGINDSLLVVSGERVFSDYKNMYGTTKEKNADWHDGANIVDRIVFDFFANVKLGQTVVVHNRYITLTKTATKSVTETQNFTETQDAVTETTTKTESPISIVAPIFAIVATTLYFRKRKN